MNEIRNELLAQAVVTHLGPSALAGGQLSPLEIFELGFNAGIDAATASAEPDARLLSVANKAEEYLRNCVDSPILANELLEAIAATEQASNRATSKHVPEVGFGNTEQAKHAPELLAESSANYGEKGNEPAGRNEARH